MKHIFLLLSLLTLGVAVGLLFVPGVSFIWTTIASLAGLVFTLAIPQSFKWQRRLLIAHVFVGLLPGLYWLLLYFFPGLWV